MANLKRLADSMAGRLGATVEYTPGGAYVAHDVAVMYKGRRLNPRERYETAAEAYAEAIEFLADRLEQRRTYDLMLATFGGAS